MTRRKWGGTHWWRDREEEIGDTGDGECSTATAFARKRHHVSTLLDVIGELKQFGMHLRDADIERITLDRERFCFEKEHYEQERQERKEERDQRRAERVEERQE